MAEGSGLSSLSASQAFDNLYYLERAAEVMVKARSMHLELEVISNEVSPTGLSQNFFIKLNVLWLVAQVRKRATQSLMSMPPHSLLQKLHVAPCDCNCILLPCVPTSQLGSQFQRSLANWVWELTMTGSSDDT